MPADCLTQDEKDVLRGIYRRDVKYWEHWGMNVKLAKQNGRAPMGLTWVVLRFKPGPELPCLREEINDIYLQCLQEYAEQYGLSVCVDPAIQKVILYDAAKAPEEWLDTCILPGRCS